jgi:hypothetical protein
VEQFVACLEGLDDPRTGNAGRHDFYEMLMIAFCTVLCGGQSAVDMALFAGAKEPFLRGFLTFDPTWTVTLQIMRKTRRLRERAASLAPQRW